MLQWGVVIPLVACYLIYLLTLIYESIYIQVCVYIQL